MRWGGTLVVMLCVGVALNFIGLAVALNFLRLQSGQGAKARRLQCQTFPISVKVYQKAREMSWISEKELETYKKNRPTNCP